MGEKDCNICKGKGLVMDGASSTTTCDTCKGTGLSAAHRKQKDCSQSAFNELLSEIDDKIADVKNGDMLTARLLFEEHHDRERALAMDDARNLLARAIHTLQRCR